MIKASELRIGNRLLPRRTLNPENNPLLGYSICACHIAYSDEELNNDWEGLPLTEEYLQRLGFADITNGYRATGQAAPVWRIASPVRGQDINLYEHWDRKAWKADGYFLGHFEYVMQYVHQLQNLYFALTGEELTIKETHGNR